jgi:hypothetical protein
MKKARPHSRRRIDILFSEIRMLEKAASEARGPEGDHLLAELRYEVDRRVHEAEGSSVSVGYIKQKSW